MADLTRRDRQFLKDLGIESQVQLSEYAALTYQPLEDAMDTASDETSPNKAALYPHLSEFLRGSAAHHASRHAQLVKLPNHMTHAELFVDNGRLHQAVAVAHAQVAEAVAAKNAVESEFQGYRFAASVKKDREWLFCYWGKIVIFAALIGEVVFALFEIAKFLRWIGGGW